MKKRKILIIDDEEDIRTVTALTLETVAEWDVVIATNGKEGIQRARQEHPDAILLDVMMPEMDGPTTFRNLQAIAETRQIPVLLLTAKVQAVDQQRFADLVVAGVLFKPFDPLTLANQIAGVLGWMD